MTDTYKPEGEIWVTDFTENSVREFRDNVNKAVTKAESKKRPIIVYIDSYGGYVNALSAMVDIIDNIPNPIATVCIGKAMSCGAILLSHGDMRYCTPHAVVMIHDVSGWAQGHVRDMVNETKEVERISKYWMGILADNCGLKGGYDELMAILDKKKIRELYLPATAALQFGIVDTIGFPSIDFETEYYIKEKRDE